MKGVTETLAQFVTTTSFEDLPEKVIYEVKRNLLDTIGCALGGLATDIGLEALTLARNLGGKPESTILETGEKTSCVLASYVNSQIANALDADETFPIPTHFANATMGASLAMSERNRSPGKELITAYAVGYELASRIGIGMRPPLFLKAKEIHGYPPLYIPGVFIVFGALGAASKILNLSLDQFQNAIGIAGTNCPIPVHGKWSEATVLPSLKYADAGWCAQLGVTASLMASIGTTGYNKILDGIEHFWRAYGIEDCDFEGITLNLGQEWHILDTTYKPWPSCCYTHYPLWLFLKIKEENHLSPQDIEKVSIRMGHIGTAAKFKNQSPTGAIACQFSHPHIIAMGAFEIEPGPRWHSFQTMEDKRIINFRKRVEVQYDPELAKIDLPSGKIIWKLPTFIEVHAKGKVFQAHTEYTKGDPWTEETYFSDEELRKKFLILASSVYSGSEKWFEQMNVMTDLIFNLERLKSLDGLYNLFGPRFVGT